MDTIVQVASATYPGLQFRPYALLGPEGIVQVIHAQGAEAALSYFKREYPSRREDLQQVWVLLGGEDT